MDKIPMTPAGFKSADNELKQFWLDTLIDKDDVFAVFDDRQQVVDTWRANGLTCFQSKNCQKIMIGLGILLSPKSKLTRNWVFFSTKH